jgi:dolichol-phosphate mannosyltransferase
MQAHPDKIFIQERKGKLGLGTAYIHGFKWALDNQYDYIFEMDADFSHNPLDLDRLLAACENGADVAIGSRYVKGGATENWPLDRLIYSKGGSLYTRIITGMPVKDPTAGFICYKNKVLAAMQLGHINFIGYAFQIEMKFASWRLGFKLKEVPITFIDRKIGVSKMSKGIIKEAVLGVLNMQWQSFTGRFIKHIKREQL